MTYVRLPQKRDGWRYEDSSVIHLDAGRQTDPNALSSSSMDGIRKQKEMKLDLEECRWAAWKMQKTSWATSVLKIL